LEFGYNLHSSHYTKSTTSSPTSCSCASTRSQRRSVTAAPSVVNSRGLAPKPLPIYFPFQVLNFPVLLPCFVPPTLHILPSISTFSTRSLPTPATTQAVRLQAMQCFRPGQHNSIIIATFTAAYTDPQEHNFVVPVSSTVSS
jgi:hypothetical protein